MTRHLVMSLSMIVIFAVAGFGQGFEVFGGYSYSHGEADATATSLLSGAKGAHGFTGSLTGNINEWFGLTGELDYHRRSETVTDLTLGTLADVKGQKTSFRFGPRFTSRINDTVSTFAHVLAGGTRQSINANDPAATGVNSSISATGFSTVAGG